MADKEVIINGKKMMYGTGVKGSAETSTNATPTFDGVITQGTDKIAYTLEIDRVSYDGYTDYKELSGILRKMLKEPALVTVKEIRRQGDKPFVIRRDYKNAVVDGLDYEINPEEQTVDNLKFTCAEMEEIVTDNLLEE